MNCCLSLVLPVQRIYLILGSQDLLLRNHVPKKLDKRETEAAKGDSARGRLKNQELLHPTVPVIFLSYLGLTGHFLAEEVLFISFFLLLNLKTGVPQ